MLIIHQVPDSYATLTTAARLNLEMPAMSFAKEVRYHSFTLDAPLCFSFYVNNSGTVLRKASVLMNVFICTAPCWNRHLGIWFFWLWKSASVHAGGWYNPKAEGRWYKYRKKPSRLVIHYIKNPRCHSNDIRSHKLSLRRCTWQWISESSYQIIPAMYVSSLPLFLSLIILDTICLL